MCGIAGILSKDKLTEYYILEKMNYSLIHRGPDSEGIFFDDNIGMCMRRLKIIDLETGDQPIFNETKDIVVILNGEIYNFKTLRDELELKGHIFRSRSDTEVLVHGYEEWGIDKLLEQLNGMYAFCIYDKKQQKVYIARDRLGEKPLYYLSNNEYFIFASELQTLLVSEKIPIVISKISLYYYLALHYVPGDMCIIKGIKKLLPGYYIEFDIKKFSIVLKQYWELKETNEEDKTYEYYSSKVKELIEDSIRLRMIADVPLGVFLSGGIDSSIIVSVMKQFTTHVNSFSVGFKNAKFDESEYSELISQKYQTDHHHFIFDQNRVREFLPRIVQYMDEPCGDQALLPVFWLSQEARKYVTTVLGGEGGDEIFAGYSYYSTISFNVKKVAAHIRSKDAITALFQRTGYSSSPGDLKAFTELLDEDRVKTLSGFPLISDLKIRMKLIKDFSFERLNKESREYIWHDQFKIELNKISDGLRVCQYTDIKSWLPDDLLMKFDKMAMANSLEGRAPYLDHRLVEFAYNIPSKYKIKGNVYKFILRDAFRDNLPEKIFKREKQGFNLPMNEWLKNDLSDLLADLHNFNYDDGIDNEYLKILIDEHLSGKAERGRLIYSLLVYRLWIKHIYDNLNITTRE